MIKEMGYLHQQMLCKKKKNTQTTKKNNNMAILIKAQKYIVLVEVNFLIFLKIIYSNQLFSICLEDHRTINKRY